MPEPDSSAIVKRAKLAAGAIVGVLLLGAVIVVVLRGFQAAALEASTTLHAKEYVTTISPGARGDKQPLTLPEHCWASSNRRFMHAPTATS